MGIGREWSEGEGVVCGEYEFGVVFDLAVDDGFGVYCEFCHGWAGGEEFDVVVVVHGFS